MQTDEATSVRREVRSRIDHRTGKRVLICDVSVWQTHVAERRRLGQSVHAYCTARGLALSTFRRWAQRLEGRTSLSHERVAAKVAFLEVPISRSQDETATDSALEVSLGPGVRVKLGGAAALQVLEVVLAGVKRAAQS